MTIKTVKGKYTNGVIQLKTIPKGLQENEEVVVVFTQIKKSNQNKKEELLKALEEPLQEVKKMSTGKLSKKTWWEMRNEL
jgi:hypothetical protein